VPKRGGTGDENERFKAFKERRDELVEMITDGTLAAMGATEQASGSRVPIVTGLSKSRKELANLDTDATQHRVKRDMFNSPFASLPMGEDPQP
jgi:predicted NUDIX family NTP pyrophosphohydrolase